MTLNPILMSLTYASSDVTFWPDVKISSKIESQKTKKILTSASKRESNDSKRESRESKVTTMTQKESQMNNTSKWTSELNSASKLPMGSFLRDFRGKIFFPKRGGATNLGKYWLDLDSEVLHHLGQPFSVPLLECWRNSCLVWTILIVAQYVTHKIT